jgi:histone-lysine N-methyltransferase SETMAR
MDTTVLLSLLEENPRLTTREMAERMSCSHTTVANKLRELGKKKKIGSWVPHKLTTRDRVQREQACTILLQKSRRFDWLDHVITGDETWVLYVNHTRKGQWVDADERPEPTPKADLHPKKVLMSIWWDVHGVVLWELLPTNVTITSALYCDQLQRLSLKVTTDRPQHKKIAIPA